MRKWWSVILVFAVTLAVSGARADDSQPFSFEYYESLPDGTQKDALQQYLLEKHPVGSDAISLVNELKKGHAGCWEGPKYDYCGNRIGKYVPYVEWSVGIGVDDGKITSINAERLVRNTAMQK